MESALQDKRAFRVILELTEWKLSAQQRLHALKRFASDFGWRPSDELDHYRGTESYCGGHLLIEHGLNVTAVISFLRADTPYQVLTPIERRNLLELSYNNLVDWHFLPDRAGMRVVYNRTDPPSDSYFDLSAHADAWRAEAYSKLTQERPNPNLRALDDALIDTLSFWKRALSSELGAAASPRHISTLFNALILIRALEDYRHHHGEQSNDILLANARQLQDTSIQELLENCLKALGPTRFPRWFQADLALLNVFDDLDPATLTELVSNLYRSRFTPYRYDFSLISKHALSRVYEHYVSLLRDKSSPQLWLFQDLPSEVRNKDLGSVYTPQYIARFFARFLRENMTPKAFRTIKSVDPACGSGMFLRTLLEMQCNPFSGIDVDQVVPAALANAIGVDVDPNACQATRLSLSLLHLVLVGDLPDNLPIFEREAMEFMSGADFPNDVDVVIANPPFVRWDGLPRGMRDRLQKYLSDLGHGKNDLYLAFLKLAIERLQPEGYLLFVLPHSFLLAHNAGSIREELARHFSIRVLADLSEIPVFDGIGSYVVLLIAQKRVDAGTPALIVRCRDFVGHALQDAIDGKLTHRDAYEVFHTPQSTFRHAEWLVLPPAEEELAERLRRHPVLGDLFEVRQGAVTGFDDVFIVHSDCSVARTDPEVWVPLLSDREMVRFTTPSQTERRMFMPFSSQGARLTRKELQSRHRATWNYLCSHRKNLENRLAVRRETVEWWAPERPRGPMNLLRPKIVTPHLVLLPRFGVDEKGRYAVTRSPYLVPRAEVESAAFLKFAVAVLNSSLGHWQIAAKSHKYSRGYLMLEKKTLETIRIPNPAALSAGRIRQVVGLVDALAASDGNSETLGRLEGLVTECFGFTRADRESGGVLGSLEWPL